MPRCMLWQKPNMPRLPLASLQSAAHTAEKAEASLAKTHCHPSKSQKSAGGEAEVEPTKESKHTHSAHTADKTIEPVVLVCERNHRNMVEFLEGILPPCMSVRVATTIATPGGTAACSALAASQFPLLKDSKNQDVYNRDIVLAMQSLLVSKVSKYGIVAK